MPHRSADATPTGKDTTPRDPLTARVEEVLSLIRPAIQSDGGDIELVEVTRDGVVRVRFLGACIGCPSSTVTLRMGVEQNLRDNIPEVTRVEAVE